MKKLFYSLTLGLAGLLFTPARAQAQAPPRRVCPSDEILRAQLAADPALAKRQATFDAFAKQYAAQQAAQRARTGQRGAAAVSVTVPVVVHVLYNNEGDNVSDAQVQSQIDVLNEDYHKLNADASKVPGPFASRVADVGIQFVLAKRNPNGDATNGIERKNSTIEWWGYGGSIQSGATGGLDPWPTDQYLNLWVGRIGGGILGFGGYGGVTIETSAFGRGGSATWAPFNLGRTGTHEVGHWLNMRHIFGDGGSPDPCADTDEVDDTPNQANANYWSPSFPTVSCGNGPDGDMFMNYMDYVNDDAMFMFSQGQADRMNATFAPGGPHAGLLTSLGGVAPTPSVAEVVSLHNGPDFYPPNVRLGVGDYTMSQLQALGIANDDLSSLQITTGYQVEVFEHDGFQGASLQLTASAALMPDGWDDRVSSLKVRAFASPLATNAVYKLVVQYTGKVADVYYARTDNGAAVVQHDDNGGANQHWQALDLGGGYWRFVNVNSGRSLETSGNSSASGSPVQQWDWVNGTNQQWSLREAGDGYFGLVNRYSGLVLDVLNWSSDNGGPLIQWDWLNGANQKWRFDLVSPARTAAKEGPANNAATGQYTLFPNPATDVLTVARPQGTDPAQPLTVRVYDLRGREVRHLAYADGKLNVGPLAPGLYVLSVSDGTATARLRFVKN